MDRNSLNNYYYLQGLEQGGMRVHARAGSGVWEKGIGREEIGGSIFKVPLPGSSAFDSMWVQCSVAAELGILYTLSWGWMGVERGGKGVFGNAVT